MARDGARPGRPARRRTDPQDTTDVAVRLLDLIDVVAELRKSTDATGAAATAARRVAGEVLSITRESAEDVGRLWAGGSGVGEVAGFVGDLAALTDLLSLNTEIDAAARRQQARELDVDNLGADEGQQVTDEDRGRLVWGAVKAAEAIAAQLGTMREQTAETLHRLASLETAVVDIEAAQLAIVEASARQAAAVTDVALRIETAYRSLLDLAAVRNEINTSGSEDASQSSA
ncbi:MAG: hypothetical protein JXA67_16140 [Micromonosporaceae bacterium]|nr:hypothetical protein [Micromonosporaceae bacterium]